MVEISTRSRRTALLGALTIVTLTSIATIGDATAPALAAPGSPGVMARPTLVSFENFQLAGEISPTYVPTLADFVSVSPPTTVEGYVGTFGQTYAADVQWNGDHCNGLLVSYDSLATTPTVPQADECGDNGWTAVRRLARALGNWAADPDHPFYGTLPAIVPEANVAVTEFTQGTTAPGTMLESVANVGIVTGHDYTSTFDLAQANCWAENEADITIDLVNADASGGAVFTQVIASCELPIKSFDSQVVGTFIGTQSVRATSPDLRLDVVNANSGVEGGNDAAFDNVALLDVTAQLDQSIASGPMGGAWAIGETAPMTLTITNTHLAGAPNVPSGARTGMGFTATLPAGLHLAGPTTTDCTNGLVREDPSGTLTGTADLSAITPSCTFSVGVTSAAAGTFSVSGANYQLVGLLAPADAAVIFAYGLAPTGPSAAIPVALAIALFLAAIGMMLVSRQRRHTEA